MILVQRTGSVRTKRVLGVKSVTGVETTLDSADRKETMHFGGRI